MALLRVFDVIDGARDYAINKDRLIIGRDKSNVDILLHDMSVSRMHMAVYAKDRGYYAEDLGSSCGTLLNNKLITVHKLRFGDNLQLGGTVIEFRADEPADNEEQLKDTIDGLMCQFRTLPSKMLLSYRVLKILAEDTFCSGDTIVVGRGGLLVDLEFDPADQRNVFELKIEWPDGNKKILFAEVVAVLQKNRLACLKLHQISELKLSAMLDKVERGCWNKVPT